jgi:hypothetical protein
MTESNRQVWIGLADVKAIPGNSIFDGAPGAYTNALSLAGDEVEYRRNVEDEFQKLGLEVQGFEDVEPLEERRGDGRDGSDVPKEILELASQLSEAKPVVYDTFYVYEQE